MDKTTRMHLDNLRSQDGNRRYEALMFLLKATDRTVDWAYEVWDQFVEDLRHRDNHVRAIAAQLLCGLAKSDPQTRMLKDFDALMVVTRDERFVTARHCLQSLWKVGTSGKRQQKMVVDRLAGRFADCAAEKNCTLIRYDIVQGLRNLYDEVKDEKIRTKALELIETEQDAKYRKKYAGVWKIR
jgi:hypothetical protein